MRQDKPDTYIYNIKESVTSRSFFIGAAPTPLSLEEVDQSVAAPSPNPFHPHTQGKESGFNLLRRLSAPATTYLGRTATSNISSKLLSDIELAVLPELS
jgi:hypothetical protein